MTNRTKLMAIGLFFIVALTLVYLNHFDNGFYFDDTHTITNNEAIRSLDNLSSFFLDANTFSSLPANRAYRPMVTTLNAISFKLGNGLDPVWFHIHMYFWYVVMLILLYFFIFRLLEFVSAGNGNEFLAMAATAFYGFHAANAETINYLISISDSFSTLCIIATLFLFQSEKLRSSYFYLIPLIIGMYTKQPVLMTVPILFLYVLLFEEGMVFPAKLEELLPKVYSSLRKTYPAIAVGTALFLTNQLLFTPDSTVSLDEDTSRFRYFYTQFFIVTHYLRNFILPTALSADPDFTVFESFFNWRVMFGLAVILGMLSIAFRSFRSKETSVIGFGILWFFLGLLPTSGFVPLFQIANDHRTFFPYVGLVIALAGAAKYIYIRYKSQLDQKKLTAIAGVFLLFIAGHAYGTYQRNEVWGTSETLWYDVTIKSPNNGRGLMNYALTQMEQGKYERTLEYYNRALELLPYYSYLQINMAILKVNMGFNEEAEQYFRNALKFDSGNPECYYYYAHWLNENGRQQEALSLLKVGVQLGPNHMRMNQLYAQLSGQENLVQINSGQVSVSLPEGKTEAEYIELSLQLYKLREYQACIAACEKALAVNARSAVAYNNMCSAFNMLKQWDKALVACKNALAIQPDFELAKNNLNWARIEYHKQMGN